MNFAIYGSGCSFEKVLKQNNAKFLDNVKVFFSDNKKNFYLKDKLKEHDIEYVLYDYDLIDKTEDRNLKLSDELLKILKEHHIDYCFSFGSHILKGELLKEYENKIINFHPAILPWYPGMRTVNKALSDNVDILGNTAHFIDSGVDTGPIIMQSVVHARAYEIGGFDLVVESQFEMLYKISELLIEGRIKVKGEKVIIDGADYEKHYILPYIGNNGGGSDNPRNGLSRC